MYFIMTETLAKTAINASLASHDPSAKAVSKCTTMSLLLCGFYAVVVIPYSPVHFSLLVRHDQSPDNYGHNPGIVVFICRQKLQPLS